MANLGLDSKASGVLEELEIEYETELAQLQNRYEKKWNPLLKERADLLCPQKAAGKGSPALPSFWLMVLKKSDELGVL